MSKTTILYKDIAPGSVEDAEATATGDLARSAPSLLPVGVSTAPIITAEWNIWGLNGTFQPLTDQKLAFWSEILSDADGVLVEPSVITITFDQQYSSTGITLDFDAATGDYCTAVNLKWYQDDTMKADVDFAPDASQYFCQENVISYNRVIITLNKTRHPYRRARLNRVLFGRLRTFDMSEIRRASVTNEMDLLTLELPVSDMGWRLDTQEDVEFMFQLKQPMEIRNGDTLIGIYYIESSSRLGVGLYDISGHNAFGVLDENPFPGGMYTDKSARELLEEILGGSFPLICEAEDTQLTGAILPGTRREAIQQVLFAWGVCASTDGVEGIRVFSPGSDPTEIGTDRTLTGASVKTDSVVTQVSVTAHSYVQDDSGNVEIGGVKYTDTQTVYTVSNPDVTASDKQNAKEITGATLVSPTIGQAVAQRVYDHYLRRSTHEAKLVWEGERLGACVTVPNSWGSTITGNIIRMDIALSNAVVASCRTLGV